MFPIRVLFRILLLSTLFQTNVLFAQSTIDFEQGIKKINLLLQQGQLEASRDGIIELRDDLSGSSIIQEDSVQLFFYSKLGYIYYQLEACDSAVSNGSKELAIRKSLNGEGHPQTLAASHNLGIYLLSCDSLEASRDVLVKTLLTHKEKLGRVDQQMIRIMDDLGYVYNQTGQYQESIATYSSLVSLLEEYSSKNDYYYRVLESYVNVLVNAGESKKAITYYDELKSQKDGSRDYPVLMMDFYNIFLQENDHKRALETCEELISYCGQTNCRHIPYIPKVFMHDAAKLSFILEDYNKAFKYYKNLMANPVNELQMQLQILYEAAAVAGKLNLQQYKLQILNQSLQLHRENGLENEESYAQVIFQVAGIFTKMGEFQQAEQTYNSFISTLGGGSDEKIKLLAKAYQSIGNQKYLVQDFKSADSYFYQALDLLKGRNLTKSVEYASLLNSLGALSEALANYSTAMANYKKAIRVMENNALDDLNLKVTLASNLAKVLIRFQPSNDSIAFYLDRATEWQIQLTGKLHPTYARLIGEKALYFQQLKDYKKALPLYQEALELLDASVGKTNNEYLSTASNLSLMYQQLQQFDKALQYMLETKRTYEENFTEDHPGYIITINNLANLYTETENFDEAEKLLLILSQKQLKQINESFSYLSEKEKETFVKEKREFLDNFKRYVVARSNEGNSQLPGELLKTWYELELSTKGMILNSTKRVRDGIFNSQNDELIALFSEWTLLRKQIADLSSLKSTEIAQNKKQIDSLNAQADIIEKGLTRKSSAFTSSFINQGVKYQNIQSALEPSEVAVEIIRVQLDESAVYLGLLVSRLNNNPQLIYIGKGDQLELNGYNRYKNAIQFKVEDLESFDYFWLPIQKTIPVDISKIYFASDGVYHKLNLATLYDPTLKTYLLEKYEIIQVTSTKAVFESRNSNSVLDPTTSSYLLVGRPDYDLGKTANNANDVLATRSFSLENISDLPGTEEEIKTVSDILEKESIQFTQFLGENSTEQNIKANLDKNIVHIATHGFFFDQKASDHNDAIVDPMLSSGLLFAGASNNNITEMSGEDGILTAFEIMNLGIQNNKMVILSACETGLGEVSAGEGIYGLQRAFFVAGTETIIMSLWKVDDLATKDLMINFYRNLLKKGDKREAFRAAQIKMKKQYKHPLYWGAFVMLGI